MIELNVGDIKQYVYCPRVVFYRYVMPVKKVATYKMEHGKKAEKNTDRLEAHRQLKRYGIAEGRREFNVKLRSEKYGLSGTLDLLIRTSDRLYPVDFKYGAGGPFGNHIYQISGYALILEEMYSCDVNKGFIYLMPSDKVKSFDLSGGDKLKTMGKLRDMREMISCQRMPPAPEERNKCADCEYLNFCGDVF